MEKIKLSQFEFDYLMAQKKVDTQIVHMDEMINKGYFHSLKDYFKTDRWGRQYVGIGTIRDLLDFFEIGDSNTKQVSKIETKWIPCSERMPEHLQDVIFTDNRGNVGFGYFLVNTGFFYSEISSYKAVAWMPLPEPYKGK